MSTNEWLPIKTAPKDAYVLLFVEFDIGDPIVTQGCWYKLNRREKGWIDFHGEAMPATHWMPLPPPPKQEAPE